MTDTEKTAAEEIIYRKDKRRLFITEFLMVAIFSAFVLYCIWQAGK
jgi:hypothetical protein